MKWVVPAALAAAMLSCAAPRAFADFDTHWLVDSNSGCSLFDANAKAGDDVSWSGGCMDGLANGKGTAVFTNDGKQFESFTGNFSKGIAQDGPVSVSWGGGWHYDGEEVAGQFSGAGVLMNDARDRFEGTWSAGKMNGHGTLTRANGEHYDGQWKDDLPDGQGTLTRADGKVVKGIFHDGKLEEATLDSSQALKPNTDGVMKDSGDVKKDDAKDDAKKDIPEARAFEGISGKMLTGVDGSRIALTLIEGGIERQITETGSQPKKTTFTFMNDRLGTVVEDGGQAAGANVTGFFRLTDTGVEVRYADGRGEMLTATPDGGVLMKLSAVDGDMSCRSWYPDGHIFSDADKKIAVAEYASRLGLGPAPKESCQGGAAPTAAAPPPIPLHPAEAKPHEKAAHAKPTSFITPSFAPTEATRSAKLAALMPVTVKDSVVHSIDEGADAAAAPPVVMTALPTQQALPSGQRDAQACLKVDSDGSHWSFRNSCGYSVQFAYCMWHGSEPLSACDDGHSISGSVAANSVATLTSDTRFGGKDDNHDFRWVACDGGAGEVVAHLDHADPPSGRCERANVATNQH
ncbi:MAG TPA: hypothetical protein VN685_03325 [Rhizomicrobium sp.]|nr:hypothetical protein [Rhizomicrobium sp.]